MASTVPVGPQNTAQQNTILRTKHKIRTITMGKNLSIIIEIEILYILRYISGFKCTYEILSSPKHTTPPLAAQYVAKSNIKFDKHSYLNISRLHLTIYIAQM